MDEIFWHFAEADADGTPRLRYDDNRAIRVGETLAVDCEPVVCEAGLHACPRLLDALRYAPPDRCFLTAVTLGGTVVHGTDNNADKYSATERTVVAMLSENETDSLLREFARWCALSVASLWDMPDVVRQYLETGDETIRAAAWAALAAARDAARNAGAAAGAAAWDTARAAAGDAARNAGAAAGAAARAAAGDAQNEQLERMARAALHLPTA